MSERRCRKWIPNFVAHDGQPRMCADDIGHDGPCCLQRGRAPLGNVNPETGPAPMTPALLRGMWSAGPTYAENAADAWEADRKELERLRATQQALVEALKAARICLRPGGYVEAERKVILEVIAEALAKAGTP